MRADGMLRRARAARLPLGIALLVSLLASAAPAAPEADTAAARTTVEEAIGAVLDVLKAEGLETDERISRIEKIAYDRFDFDTMSKLVLGRNRRDFSGAQQKRFTEQFRTYLSNQYGHRVESYEQESIEVLGERAESRGDVTVFTKVVGGEYAGATIDYRLRATDGVWRVIDVIIEGVSLVSNYRDQFGEVIARKGADGLLAQLEEKNAKGEVDEVPTPEDPES